MRGFYFITDSALSRRGIFEDAENAVKAGVKIVQYREKNKPALKMYEEAQKLRKICRGIVFLVNDRVDIALSVGADGVHLGQDDLPVSAARMILGKKRIIGLTVHNLKEALYAQKQGVDYIGVSPVFPTRTKSDAGRAVGIRMLRQISDKIKLPIVALGGIGLRNVRPVIEAGADCVSAISAVVTKKDVSNEIAKFQKEILRIF